MSENNEEKDLSGELDLSSLSSLSLEPSWASGDKTGKISVGRVARDDRRPRGNAPRQDRSGGGFRDRRPPRPPRERDSAASGPREFRPPRRERDAGRDNPPPRRDERRGEGGFRGKGRAPRGNAVHAPRLVEVSFFPEEKPFGVLAKAVKNSARTYALFEIANLILEKPERFTVCVKPFARKPAPAKKSAPAAAASDAAVVPAQEAPAAPSLFVSVPDGMPFLSEADVLAYVFNCHADKFFTVETIEIEPPKGNFSMVSKCGFTGELLAPPNYHAYQQILRDHHAANFPKMPFEKFMSRLETVRDQESIDAWIAKMKTVVRYTVKDRRDGEPESLDGAGAAKAFLLSNRKSKVVRAVGVARFPGKLLEKMPLGPVKAGIETELAFQRRFPLDTANFLRGRLRRAGFSLFKRGAKGITLVCAVRRKFRTPDSVFSDTIQRVFDFLEKNPNTKIQDLPKRMLGIGDEPSAVPAPDAPASPDAAAPAETVPEEAAPVPAPAPAVPAADAEAQLSELFGSVRWLVLEGYVSEMSDGSLFTYPKMTAAQAKAAAKEDEAESKAAGEEAAAREDDIAAEIPAPIEVPADAAAAPAAETAVPAPAPEES